MAFAGGGHSIFAPSSSARYFSCHGSLLANLFSPDDAGYEAAEGTVAHALAEEWLKTGVRPTRKIGTTVTIKEHGEVFEVPITQSMLDYVQEYVDWCRFEAGEMFTEIKVWFTDLMPWANEDEVAENPDAVRIPFLPQGGTADNIIINDSRIIITDLKYGKGVQVFATGNTQALLYAYGVYRAFCDEYDIDTIEIRIAQPRFNHFDSWEITVGELLDFAEWARGQFKKAWDINAPRKASVKACIFCKASSDCAALAYLAECAVGGDTYFLDKEFGVKEMSELREALRDEYKMRRAQFGTLSTEEMAKILPLRRVIENWLRRLDQELEARASKGAKVPGHKLVESRTNRAFNDPERVIALFEFLDLDKDDYIKTELRSPAQMEEILRDKLGLSRAGAPAIIEKFVYKPPGRPTLAPDTDQRPPMDGRYTGAFDDEDDDEV